MAVIETGAIFKSLRFDGVDSRDYGVYISGEAVFNAPERDVTMITIPGRSGTFAQDNGRFNNITVAYPAGLFASSEGDFAEAVSAFRNALASRKGYCRIEDDYNPDEYRMAVYKSGLEVTPAALKAGEFSIVFECKPQRFLKSGDEWQTMTNNGYLNNPTLFDAHPLLEVRGYGAITMQSAAFETREIDIIQAGGEQSLLPASTQSFSPSTVGPSVARTGDFSVLASGDTINVDKTSFRYDITPPSGELTSVTTSNESGSALATVVTSYNTSTGYVAFNFSGVSFTYGTAASVTKSCTIAVVYSNGNLTKTLTATIAYDGANTITCTMTGGNATGTVVTPQMAMGAVTAYSTKVIATYMYIDLETGFAYYQLPNEKVSANGRVILPTDLPVLAVGNYNRFTFDDTITQLRVQPRWWII